MKVKKVLFVGGPSDGYRKEDPWSGPTAHIAHFDKRDWLTYLPDPGHFPVSVQDLGVKTETYYRKKFRDENGVDYEAFFHSSVKNPMEALLQGYRYHRNKRDRRHTNYKGSWKWRAGQPIP